MFVVRTKKPANASEASKDKNNHIQYFEPPKIARSIEVPDTEPFRNDSSESESDQTEGGTTSPERDSPEYWNQIKQYLTTFEIPMGVQDRKRFIRKAQQYLWYNNRIWKKSQGGPPLLVIRENQRRLDICKEAHDESGHRGRDPTYKKLSDRYYWPQMYTTVVWYCQTCKECQYHSAMRPKILLCPTYVNTILRKMGIDLIHMPNAKGYKYIVDARDDLSGWLEARMLKSKKSQGVAKFLFEDIMCCYGCLISITTDGGSEFRGIFKALAKHYKIPIVRTSPYHPEANGMIKRGHRTWIGGLFKVCGEDGEKEWPTYFEGAKWVDRVTAKRTTGLTPYYLMYGRHHVFPFDITDRSWYVLDWSNIKTTEDLIGIRTQQLVQRDEDIEEVSKKILGARIRAAEDFAKRHEGNYEPGTMVLSYQRDRETNFASKGKRRWAGPYKIEEQFKLGAYKLQELDDTYIKGTIAGLNLKRFFPCAYLDGSIVPEEWNKVNKASNTNIQDNGNKNNRVDHNKTWKSRRLQHLQPAKNNNKDTDDESSDSSSNTPDSYSDSERDVTQVTEANQTQRQTRRSRVATSRTNHSHASASPITAINGVTASRASARPL